MTKRVYAGLRARRKTGALLVVSVGGALAAAQVAAQNPSQVTIDASRCLELKSPEARLACYQSQVDAALGTQKKAEGSESSQGASQASSKDERAATKTIEAEKAAKAEPAATGAHAAPAANAASPAPPNRGEQSSARESRADRHAREQNEIVGTIAALREREPNQLVITLEDGQVWQQTAPERYELRVGSQVRLRSSRWGSMYRLTDDQLRGFILVKRIQ